MATPTRKQLNAAKAKALAEDTNLVYDAMAEVDEAKGVMKLGDVLRDTARTLTSRRIGKMWSDLIRNGTAHEKKLFLKSLIEAMVTFEKTHTDNSETQVSRLTDDQIEAMLANEYGIVRKSELPGEAGGLEEEILESAGDSIEATYQEEEVGSADTGPGDSPPPSGKHQGQEEPPAGTGAAAP